MTDTKTQLQAERDQLATRSKELAEQLTRPIEDRYNHHLNNLAGRSMAQLDRHKNALDDLISVIDLRIQLIDVTADVEASLQEPASVE